MGVVNGDGEWSGGVARARVGFRCSVRCMGRKGLWLHLGSSSDVRATARLSYSGAVRHG